MSGRARPIVSRSANRHEGEGLPAFQFSGAKLSKPRSAALEPERGGELAGITHARADDAPAVRGMAKRGAAAVAARLDLRRPPARPPRASTISRELGAAVEMASSTAVPTVGWPANGNSRAGVKMRSARPVLRIVAAAARTPFPAG